MSWFKKLHLNPAPSQFIPLSYMTKVWGEEFIPVSQACNGDSWILFLLNGLNLNFDDVVGFSFYFPMMMVVVHCCSQLLRLYLSCSIADSILSDVAPTCLLKTLIFYILVSCYNHNTPVADVLRGRCH